MPVLPWPWLRGRSKSPRRDREPGPLREFVYLDEVSLRSLLSSQTGEIKDTVSEQYESAILSELGLKLTGDVPFAAKGEAGTRFQTSNSSTLQTSRKATVQSWFRDLHDRSELRLISPVDLVKSVDSVAALGEIANPSIAVISTALERGVMAEFRVRLTAHPAFHLTTMMTEFAGVTEDSGDLLPPEAQGNFRQILPMVKVLERLMAGLIPIHAEAVDHVVATIDGADYVVHRGAIEQFDLSTRPLVIVGVTDQSAYWKDIRRVLFSNAAFTMLCRVSRPGLHDDWVPVKLMDIFSKVAPDFSKQISAAWEIPFSAGALSFGEPEPEAASPLEVALARYAASLLATRRRRWSEDELAVIRRQIASAVDDLRGRSGSVSDQKSAFVALKALIAEIAGVRIAAAKDLKLRDDARAAAGLSLFPKLEAASASHNPRVHSIHDEEAVAYLDTEVVAIYW